MSERVKITVISIVAVAVIALSFGAGYTFAGRTRLDTGQGLDLVVEAWDLIFDNYVEPDKLDASKLSQAAISGVTEALGDPYTYYLSPDVSKLGLSSLEGKFGGIGAMVTVKDEQVTIIAPIPGSPAAEAGIRAGDVILEVNGTSTSGMSLAEAVLSIRGPEGTPVTLLVQHQGEPEPEEIEIIRGEIKLPSVHFEMKEDIAYINITYFSGRTDEELSQVIGNIDERVATGIILDLRSNPGGLLEAVVDATSYFLREGVVVNVRDKQGELTTRYVTSGRVVTDLPMVVLVDSYSASGSEVMAGALRDNSRATIAGSKTYGKGSVNMVHPLKDGSSLSITAARWLTPDGHTIEGEGLTPDYELEPEGDAIEWAIDYLKRQDTG